MKYGIEANSYVSTRLLHMYLSCVDMEYGLKPFYKIPKWNVVVPTCFIAGYVNTNQPHAALKVFKDKGTWGVVPW